MIQRLKMKQNHIGRWDVYKARSLWWRLIGSNLTFEDAIYLVRIWENKRPLTTPPAKD